ncbi:DUF6624 domain-containing protein [Kribbella sp. NPDC003505]|uniref:DUF6624 domain-containing protein n=1 Tax=Kribbella sp. NPDC003505 TaxID=3154448 RepID=UPI0033BF32AC
MATAVAAAGSITACSADGVSGSSSGRDTPAMTSPSSTRRVLAPAPVKIDKPPLGASVGRPELRAELLAMLAQDQAVRTGTPPPGDKRTPEELGAAWEATDRANAQRMAKILDEHGWPGWNAVGSNGAQAAWVLIQHADLDLPLQERGLALMKDAVAADDADPSDLAYLVDRVRVAKNEPQVYGTQWGRNPAGKLEPRTPIEDEVMVDIRRAAVGLGTIDAYLKELAAAFGER